MTSLRAFLRARFERNSHLGLPLTMAVLVLLGASWFFGSIAEEVATGDEITNLDLKVSQWFHSHANKLLTRAVLVVTHLHGIAGLTILSLFMAVFMFRKKEWSWLLTLAVAIPGGTLLNVGFKHIFERARPHFDEPLLSLTTYSFPSGHAAGATVFYGVLAAYLISKVRLWRWRALIAASAVALVALVALSRLYLGVHYLSDVVAGIAEGIAWLALIFGVIHASHQRVTRHTNCQSDPCK
jgi:membrane-associated phospholipid phosphatase